MLKSRQQLSRDEEAVLAPYAQRVSASAGRQFDEPAHAFRTDFQRDRARVIHSRAFRRLEYKTQVFLNGTGDHLRTRLTHTIEVASISRTLARALGLNEDLTEVIALAHDLGHAPVGHAGEDRLNALMEGRGGFEHNQQSLRIVESIETRYPHFDGLNLTYEVREGLRKHDGGYVRPDPDGGGGTERFANPSLEAQIANLADEITYYSHDLEDGIDYRLIDPRQLEDIAIWREARDRVRDRHPGLDGERFLSAIIRGLIDREVEDLVASTNRRVTAAGVQSADAVRRHPEPLAGHSGEIDRMNRQLRSFLYQNLYFHPAVSVPNQRGCDRIEAVFEYYLKHPGELGERTAERLQSDGLERTVCDYVSGMTDRYLMEALNGGRGRVSWD